MHLKIKNMCIYVDSTTHSTKVLILKEYIKNNWKYKKNPTTNTSIYKLVFNSLMKTRILRYIAGLT